MVSTANTIGSIGSASVESTNYKSEIFKEKNIFREKIMYCIRTDFFLVIVP
jgi:hypothetical protein